MNDLVRKNEKIVPNINAFFEEFRGKSEEELELIAKQKTQEIFENIGRIAEKIKNAEDLVEKSKNEKGGFLGFGETAKKTEFNIQALSQHNEALSEMNTLIQESITLTCSSVFFAKKMVEIMSAMMVGALKDEDGKIIELSEVQQKHADVILQNAKNFVKHQMEYEERQNQQDEAISGLQEEMDEKDLLDERQSQDIGQNKENIEKNKSEIETLHLKLKDKENIDNAQEQEIKNLKIKLENLEAKVNKKGSFMPYLVSVFALIVAIISIALNLFK